MSEDPSKWRFWTPSMWQVTVSNAVTIFPSEVFMSSLKAGLTLVLAEWLWGMALYHPAGFSPLCS